MSYSLDTSLQRSLLLFEESIKTKETLHTYTQHIRWFLEFTKIKNYVLEDADFSLVTIKQLIRQGQEDAERILNGNI
jgi:hypothetical protein